MFLLRKEYELCSEFPLFIQFFMIMNKIRVAIIFGGKSTEHEISKLSASSILEKINQDKYAISLIKIDLDGQWWLFDETKIEETSSAQKIRLDRSELGTGCFSLSGSLLSEIDVFFPVLHGTYGEDGTIQGLFRMLDAAFVGCDVLASANCMDKDFTKRILRDAGINIAPYLIATSQMQPSFEEIEKELGMPVYLKPAQLGSSVGVYKIDNKKDYIRYVEEGLSLDTKVLIEQEIKGREIECAVLGNEQPNASLPGEIIMNSDFYDFESKYVDSNASSTQVPADITETETEIIRQTAIKAYKAINCEGLARVDFFLTQEKEVLINEINTLPGFTKISMYPKMWEATGISYTELLDILIDLAIERQKRYSQLKVFAKKVQ